jgi:hypothetical protein
MPPTEPAAFSLRLESGLSYRLVNTPYVPNIAQKHAQKEDLLFRVSIRSRMIPMARAESKIRPLERR